MLTTRTKLNPWRQFSQHIYIIYIYTELRYNLIAIVQYKSGNWQCNVIVNGTALKIYKFPDNVVSCIVRLWQSGAAPLLLMFAPHIITRHMVEDCLLVRAIGSVQVWATWQVTRNRSEHFSCRRIWWRYQLNYWRKFPSSFCVLVLDPYFYY